MSLLKLLPLLAILALPVFAQKPTKGKVTVFVMSATDDNGFVNPALADSANDLYDKIGGKWLERAKSEESADLIVIVTNRFFQGSGIVKSDYNPYSHTMTVGEAQLRIVTAKIIARDESATEVYGYDTMLWKNAANGAKKILEQFVEHNYARIASMRSTARSRRYGSSGPQ